MSRLVETVQEQVAQNCLITGRLRKEGCSVSLRGVPKSRLIIDFDKPRSPMGPRQVRCDYLFFADDIDSSGWVVPLELKNGELKANAVVKQLRAGARVARQLVPKQMAVGFRPVVAYGGGIRKAERDELKKRSTRIRFHGAQEHIRLIKCSSALVQVFKS